MIRQPTDESAAFAWWREALKRTRCGLPVPPVSEGDPRPGYYRRRMVSGGVWVPVRIWIEQVIDPETGDLTEPEQLMATVGAEPACPWRIWTHVARHPITADQWQALIDRAAVDHLMGATHAAPSDIIRRITR